MPEIKCRIVKNEPVQPLKPAKRLVFRSNAKPKPGPAIIGGIWLDEDCGLDEQKDGE